MQWPSADPYNTGNAVHAALLALTCLFPAWLTGETAHSNEPPVALNPFGSVFTLLSWALLLGVNLYCFWRLLHSPRDARERS